MGRMTVFERTCSCFSSTFCYLWFLSLVLTFAEYLALHIFMNTSTIQHFTMNNDFQYTQRLYNCGPIVVVLAKMWNLWMVIFKH